MGRAVPVVRQWKKLMPGEAKTFADCLAAIPIQQRVALEAVCRTIKATAPTAEEGVSYGLPAFRLGGKPLVAIGAAKKHCAFYPMSGTIIETLADDLADFDTSKGTIRFSPERPLPARLIKKIVKARMLELASKSTLKDRAKQPARRKTARPGVTLIELFVVLAIIALLAALMFPAVQKARERARETICKNNLHQINIAIGDFTNVHKRIPGPGSHGAVGGWEIELLPFLEQKNLSDKARPGTPVANADKVLFRRPTIYECPMQLSYDDAASGVMDRSHYVLVPSRGRKTCAVYDAPVDFNEPWASGPEVSGHTFRETIGPHHGGFFWVSPSRGVEFINGK